MQSQDVAAATEKLCSESCPVPEIDAEAGTDLREILTPLSPPHNISAERIEHISRACTSLERVEGVAMRLRSSYARKSRNYALKNVASVVSFILIAIVVVANEWFHVSVVRTWRAALLLAMCCIVVFLKWNDRQLGSYEARFDVAMQRLQDIIALGRGAADSGDNNDDKKKD